MEQLTIIGTEDEAIVLATESGERFALAIDDVLRAELRRAPPGTQRRGRTPRPSPREIQAHIRAGLSAAEVADLLGARVEDVARFEGPVLAEREHIVGQALAVPVLIGGDLEHDAHPTFGAADPREARRGRRHGRAVDELEGADRLDRQARVHGERRRPRRPLGLRPSPQHPVAAERRRHPALAPGIAARGPDPAAARPRADSPLKDDSRFDSGAFGPRRLPDPEAESRSRPTLPEPVAPSPCRTPRSSARPSRP